MASTETTAEPVGPVPPPPPPPRRETRRWPRRVLLIFAILLTLPGAVIFCLALQGNTLSIESPEPTSTETRCPDQIPPFTDCYTGAKVTVTPVAGSGTGALRICCDFVAERQYEATVSFRASGALDAQWINADVQTTGMYRRVETAANSNLEITVTGAQRASLPLLGGVMSRSAQTTVLKAFEAFTARLPSSLQDFWRSGPTTATATVSAAPASTGREIIVRADDREVLKIGTTSELFQSLLFHEHVDNAGELGMLGAEFERGLFPPATQTGDRIRELATSSDYQGLSRDGLNQAASLIDLLNGVSVSRLSRLAEEVETFKEAGAYCIALYQTLRAILSRLDATLTTYAIGLPTGLLSRQPGTYDHGCVAPGSEADVTALNAGWQALGLRLPEIETSLEKPLAEPTSIDTDQTDSEPAKPAQTPGRFLLSIASAMKSGAQAETLKTGLAQSLTVQIGEARRSKTHKRDEVIRMLFRQWSHAGCWLYENGKGAATLTLHVEAQFPYLNHIAFRRAVNGLITAVEVTGVTYSDLLGVKRLNRGKDCQAFLDPTRMADYEFWLAAEGVGARTPVDHALRLLSQGPEPDLKLRLP